MNKRHAFHLFYISRTSGSKGLRFDSLSFPDRVKQRNEWLQICIDLKNKYKRAKHFNSA